MDTLQLLILGVAVGSNNLAVALALGAMGQRYRIIPIVLVFTTFEFFVPLLGMWLGAAVAQWIAGYAATIGALLFLMLGLLTLLAAFRISNLEATLAPAVHSPLGLVILAAGLSADNAVAGFSVGLEKSEPFLIAATIAFFAATFIIAGILLGRRLSVAHQKLSHAASGLLLIFVAALMWTGNF